MPLVEITSEPSEKLKPETYESLFPAVTPLLDAGPSVVNYRLITPAIPITVSNDGAQKIFHQFHIHLGGFDVRNFKLLLSGDPSAASPIIVDDGIMVNGRLFGGFAGTKTDPKRHIGQDPIVAYHPIEAVDISADLRADGNLFIQLMDVGGYTYTSSRIYLITLKR